MKNEVLVDTDILSYILKQKNPIVTAHYETYLATYEQLSISRITVVEILGGLKAKNAVRQLAEFETFIAKHTILDTNQEVAQVASEVFAQLYRVGKHSGNFDVLNAAIAIVNGLAICTNNEKDYENISGLTVENWTRI